MMKPKMTHDDLIAHLVASLESKLAGAIETHNLTSYAEAKAIVQRTTVAGPAVWAILDAKYSGNVHP